jgi:hypothetical protein
VVVALRRAEGRALRCRLAGRSPAVLYRLTRTNDVGHRLLGRMSLIVARGRS